MKPIDITAKLAIEKSIKQKKTVHIINSKEEYNRLWDCCSEYNQTGEYTEFKGNNWTVQMHYGIYS